MILVATTSAPIIKTTVSKPMFVVVQIVTSSILVKMDFGGVSVFDFLVLGTK